MGENQLLESLNLNVGMDALMKLEQAWGKKKTTNVEEVKQKIMEPEDEDSMQSSRKIHTKYTDGS